MQVKWIRIDPMILCLQQHSTSPVGQACNIPLSERYNDDVMADIRVTNPHRIIMTLNFIYRENFIYCTCDQASETSHSELRNIFQIINVLSVTTLRTIMYICYIVINIIIYQIFIRHTFMLIIWQTESAVSPVHFIHIGGMF